MLKVGDRTRIALMLLLWALMGLVGLTGEYLEAKVWLSTLM